MLGIKYVKRHFIIVSIYLPMEISVSLSVYYNLTKLQFPYLSTAKVIQKTLKNLFREENKNEDLHLIKRKIITIN